MKMSKVFPVILAAFLFVPRASLMAGIRRDVPNDMDLELGGRCLLYSFSYQRMLAEPFGLQAGVSMIGGGSSGGSSSILFVSVGGKAYFLPGNASPFLGGGLVTVTSSTTAGPFSSGASGVYGYVNPGFEYRSDSGFLVRGSVYTLFAGDAFFVWPGLSIGLAF